MESPPIMVFKNRWQRQDSNLRPRAPHATKDKLLTRVCLSGLIIRALPTELHCHNSGEGWNRTNSRGLTAKKELLDRNVTKPKFVRRSTIELLPQLVSNATTRADGPGGSLVRHQERLTRYIQPYFFLMRS